MAVVRDLDLHVGPGEVVLLLGPNGAGKTTTLATLAGVITPMSGEIRWEGRPARGPHHRRAREGLSLVAERSVFTGLSTRDNLRLGPGAPERAVGLFPELGPLLDRRAGLLSGGEQQILSLARALAHDPKVLMVDEMSFGLAPVVVERLLRAVRGAADRGIGVLLVEQPATRALEVADRAYVMRRGRVELGGRARDIGVDDLRQAYLA
jgi:branched-chain amino acid transport system ATP-binding protein